MLSKIFAVSNIGPYLVFKLRNQQKWGITKGPLQEAETETAVVVTAW